MKITDLKVEGASADQLKRYLEIFQVLIEKGALDGILSGSVQIHFHDYEFVGVQFSYFPWKKRVK